MTANPITPATSKQMNSLSDLLRQVGDPACRKVGLSREGAQEVLRRGGDFKSAVEAALVPILRRFSVPSNIVSVPDISATELTAALDRERQLTYLDRDQAVWDFYTGVDGQSVPGRGKKYEVIVWKPDLKPSEVISSEAVRAHFRDLGAFGHVGVFTQWLRQVKNPTGCYVSIPEDNQCWRSPYGHLYAPYSIFGVGNRELDRHWLDLDWNGNWSFVGFREIP